MRVATQANVRTAQAAGLRLARARADSAISWGSVMGVGVASLAVLGLGLFVLFAALFMDGDWYSRRCGGD